MRFTLTSLVCVGLLLAGCGQYANPNDLSSVQQTERASVAFELMQNVVGKLEEKFQRGEITDAQREEYIAKFAEEVMPTIDRQTVPKTDLWKYADLLRTTKRWQEAESVFQEAVKFASTPDRKVNDTLRLAQAMAKNEKVGEAISTARTVFNAKDEDAAPILPATLYEIVPAAKDQGKNKELAGLLKEAISCHMRVKVDTTTDAGRLFVAARRHHVSRAEAEIQQLQAGG